ncbi:hypothetical protein Pla8534_47320 [Lignipirellula cremea]|uniref:Uncharacterized protein n=1 Tax=Lignipirellula cremea TaxID=2528010 RepID=A0A518DYI4_9BACT|nr:hypothetical protein Pla8534_47320 [Lignipirellula cremea]
MAIRTAGRPAEFLAGGVKSALPLNPRPLRPPSSGRLPFSFRTRPVTLGGGCWLTAR